MKSCLHEVPSHKMDCSRGFQEWLNNLIGDSRERDLKYNSSAEFSAEGLGWEFDALLSLQL
jgi:hypothetical protein